MKNRVLGFSGPKKDRAVIYVHRDEKDRTLVDGRPAVLHIAGAGEPVEELPGIVIRVRHAPCVPQGAFIAFPEGVILERIGGEENYPALKVLGKGFVYVSSPLEFWEELKVGVLTVSDKGSRGQRRDTSGPALESAVALIGGRVSNRDIVPDDMETISGVLEKWVSEHLEIVLVTGGTGISPRDVTPESVRVLGGKEVPGIGEYMRWKTSFLNERSILSRSLAMACGQTLVLTLPGSERGALQCFHAVAPVLRHAVEILTGRGGECSRSQ